MKLLLVGATGLVGGHVLEKALADDRIDAIVAPGRRVFARHAKLLSPVVDFGCLPEHENWWRADALVCTLGTTMKKAGSKDAFYRVDHDYPLAVARLARRHGTPVFVLTSAIGANDASFFFYNRVKGEVEKELAGMGFESLTFARPGLIGGKRQEARPLETALGMVKRILHPVLPKNWRINPADRIAAVLLEAAIRAEPGMRVVGPEEMV